MTEIFDPEWLKLRESVDHRSRASAAISLLKLAWKRNEWSRIVDLGSGTGSNVRYLSPRLPGAKQWTLVDHDIELFDRLEKRESFGEVACIVGDLADVGIDVIRDCRAELVTGSALLDLVSKEWLTSLAMCCREVSCAAYFALTYDGTVKWRFDDGLENTVESDDEFVRQAVNRHQRREKGLGQALGPMAGLNAEIIFRNANFRVWLLRSPWLLTEKDSQLVHKIVSGWQLASLEQVEGDDGKDGARSVDRVLEWAESRHALIDKTEFTLTVGHLDLLALPKDSSQ